MVVAIPEKNHGPLRQMMVRLINGEDIPRDEQLRIARRHGQDAELFDIDLATMRERFRLHAEYWASPEGVAITDARQKLAEAAKKVNEAIAEFASDAKVNHLREVQANAANELNKLQNANTGQFQAFAKAMKATAFPDGDYMAPSNVWIH